MKTSYVMIVAAVLGVALGAGISWARFHESPALVTAARRTGLPSNPAAKGTPKALVDTRLHDFGPIDRDTKAVHVFHITNMGDAPLSLKAGGTSCTQCTIAELSKTTLPPGETADVRVEYLTKYAQQRFHQRAEVLTNDPEQPVIEMLILGTITTSYQVEPQYVLLGKVSANETRTSEVRIFSFLSDEVSLEKYEFTGQESAPFFEVTSQPIPRDQLTDPKAKSGCLVLVTLKPGLPLGAIRQTIRLDLKLAGQPATTMIEIPFEGTIDSDISIIGRGWNADAGRLRIGDVDGAKGMKCELFLVVRGPHRREVTVKPQRVDPAWLKVSLGEAVDVSTGTGRDGGVTKIPLTIEIPPGTPPANHLGSDQGKYGELILETTHADVTQIRMYLQFVVVQ